jgi:Co/Zn/Cd efflux system component
MRCAWICTRNDVLGNLAVLLAAAGVFGTRTGWPDVIVAVIMAALALQGASTVIRRAKSELQSGGHWIMPAVSRGSAACVTLATAWHPWKSISGRP